MRLRSINLMLRMSNVPSRSLSAMLKFNIGLGLATAYSRLGFELARGLEQSIAHLPISPDFRIVSLSATSAPAQTLPNNKIASAKNQVPFLCMATPSAVYASYHIGEGVRYGRLWHLAGLVDLRANVCFWC